MKRSTERILTTHTGSLPRPQEVVDLLLAQEEAARIRVISMPPWRAR